MEVDLKSYTQIYEKLQSAESISQTIYSELLSYGKGASDPHYVYMAYDVIRMFEIKVLKYIKILKDDISEIEKHLKNAEKENFIIAEKLGGKVDLDAGLKYYETGLGEGNSGTIGSDVRPEDAEYVVDRIAIYANGMLIDNIGETGTDIDKCIMDYEKKYGKIEISYHVSMVGEDGSYNATGWLDRAQVAEESSVSDDAIDLEEVFKEIDKKYESNNKNMSEKAIRDKYFDPYGVPIMAGVVSDMQEYNASIATTGEPEPATIEVPRSENTSQRRTAILEKQAGEYQTGDKIIVDDKEYIVQKVNEEKYFSAHHAVIEITDNNGDEDSLIFDFTDGPTTEYVNPVATDTGAPQTTTATTTTPVTGDTQPTTTTAATTTTPVTGGTQTTTTAATTTTTTTASQEEKYYGISMDPWADKTTDSISLRGNVSDLKEGDKFFLSNGKEKEIAAIEDIGGGEYKITYRGSFGGWDYFYIKEN